MSRLIPASRQWIVFVSLVGMLGCGHLGLRAQWEQSFPASSRNRAKDSKGQALDGLESRFCQLSLQKQQEEIRSLVNPDAAPSSDEFSQYFSEILVRRAVKLDDQVLLRRVLAGSPPSLIEWTWLEVFLAEQREGKFFPSLFDAFRDARNMQARRRIAEALLRAFPAQTAGQTEVESVRQAENWYRNQTKKEINPAYPGSPLPGNNLPLMLREGMSPPPPPPLFLPSSHTNAAPKPEPKP